MPNMTISGHKLEVPDAVVAKFQIGYPLQTEGEVAALRQTFLENIGNNFRSRIKNLLNGNEELTPEQVQQVQTELNEYAGKYEFGVRQAGTGTRTVRDPVEKEMRRLASTSIREAYFAKYKQKIDKETLEEKTDELLAAKHDEYAKRARRNLKEKESIGEADLAAVGL